MTGARYDLWYWPSIQGRGEFVRLFMAAAGIGWRDRAREADAQALVEDMEERADSGDFAPYAPPYLAPRDDPGFAIAQVAHIVAWLTDRHDLGSGDMATDLHLIQLQLTITDIVAEVHDTHHPVAGGLYYDDQMDAAARAAKAFRKERIPKYLDHFESALGKRGGPFVRGTAWSHVDTSLFQLVEGLHHAFPERMGAVQSKYPKLHACRDAISRIESVAAYLCSDARIAFNEDGIFRHYPELDGT